MLCDKRLCTLAGVLTLKGATVTVTSCFFSANFAPGFGGVGFVDTTSTLVVRNSVFDNNEALNLGGVFYVGGHLKCTNSTFMHNRAQGGGAVNCANGLRGQGGKCEFANTALWANGAMEKYGGGVLVTNGDLSVTDNSDLDSNRAQVGGGSLSQEGGIMRLESMSFSNDTIPTQSQEGKSVRMIRVQDWDALSVEFKPFEPASVHSVGSSRLECGRFPCAPGFGCQVRRRTRVCEPCENGTASIKGVSCEPCPPGHEPARQGRACNLCLDGTFSKFGASCMACPGNMYSRSNSSNSSSSAEPTTTRVNDPVTSGKWVEAHASCWPCTGMGMVASADHTSCECGETFFSLEGDTKCKRCPEHTFCPGGPAGNAKMFADKGWWIDDDDTKNVNVPSVYRCENEHHCTGPFLLKAARVDVQGGVDVVVPAEYATNCSKGSTTALGNGTQLINCCGAGTEPGTVMCAKCDTGNSYSKLGNAGCVVCTKSNVPALIVSGTVYVGMGVAFVMSSRTVMTDNYFGILTT